MATEFVVDFPTLGDLWSAWIEQHCRVPDRHERGKAFREYDWQFWCTANDGRIREGVEFDPARPPLNQAFVYRRSQVIAPQKMGKGPWTACRVALAAVGPSEFAGWAVDGDVYRCSDNGCACGWEYPYIAGEPMGMRHPSPLIQVMATSEDQVDNIWRPLVSMIHLGPLKALLLPRENFIRVIGESGDKEMDRIDRVTASALSRLGQPISNGFFDESGLFTTENKLRKVADTMRRGAAGMGGRTFETTNPYDPAENSYAQQTLESTSRDVFRFWRDPDKVLKHQDGTPLKFNVARDRLKILAYVYEGADHINLASIDAEAAELMQSDPAQAERFFGNRLVQGLGSWIASAQWASAEDASRVVEPGASICLGFDGSDSDDWTTIRARTLDGFHFTPHYGPDDRPTTWKPSEWGGIVPRGEVHAAIDEICTKYRVIRAYCDPFGWQTDIGDWAVAHGDKVFMEWRTNRDAQMHEALVQYATDLGSERLTHDSDADAATCISNARKVARNAQRYVLGKPVGAYHQKIDVAMADVLAHRAGEDARQAGWNDEPEAESFVYFAN